MPESCQGRANVALRPEERKPSTSTKVSPVVSSRLVASYLDHVVGEVPPRGPHGPQTYQYLCLPRPLELEVGAAPDGGKRGRLTGWALAGTRDVLRACYIMVLYCSSPGVACSRVPLRFSPR